MSVLHHAWTFELCLAIHSKVNFVIMRQVLQRRIDVYEVAVEKHWHDLEHPEDPFLAVGGRRRGIKERRGAKCITDKNQEAGKVKAVHQDLDLVREDIGLDAPAVEDADQTYETEEPGDTDQYSGSVLLTI